MNLKKLMILFVFSLFLLSVFGSALPQPRITQALAETITVSDVIPANISRNIRIASSYLRTELNLLNYSSGNQLKNYLNTETNYFTSFNEFNNFGRKVNEFVKNLVEEMPDSVYTRALISANINLRNSLQLPKFETESVESVLNDLKTITDILVKINSFQSKEVLIQETRIEEEIMETVKPSLIAFPKKISEYKPQYFLKEANEIGEVTNAWRVDFRINGNYAVWKEYDAVNHSVKGKLHFYNLNTGQTRIIDVGSDFRLIDLVEDKVMWSRFEQGGTMFYSVRFNSRNINQNFVNETAISSSFYGNQLIYLTTTKTKITPSNVQEKKPETIFLRATALTQHCALMGDVDRDGRITQNDVDLAFELALTGGYDVCADMNEDGIITAKDAQMISLLVNNCSLMGDVDGDGELTCKDVKCIFDLALGKFPVATSIANRCLNVECADMNQDGRITAEDAQLLQSMVCPNGTCNYDTGKCEMHSGTVKSQYEFVLINVNNFNEIKRFPAHKDAQSYYAPMFNGKYYTANRLIEENGEVTAVYQDFYNVSQGRLIDSVYAGTNRYLPKPGLFNDYAVWVSEKNNKPVLNLFNLSDLTTTASRNKELELNIGVNSVDGGISIHNDRVIFAGENNTIISYHILNEDVFVYEYPRNTNFLELKFYGNRFIWRNHLPGHGPGSNFPRQKIYVSGFPLEQNINQCSRDIKVCPDGSTVERSPALGCAFRACPITHVHADRFETAKSRHENRRNEFNALVNERNELIRIVNNTTDAERRKRLVDTIQEKTMKANEIIISAKTNINSFNEEKRILTQLN